MEEIIIPDYLQNPAQILIALDLLEKKSSELPFLELYTLFEDALRIKSGDGLPITAVHLAGPTCRARLHDNKFNQADNVRLIGVKLTEITQGRANPLSIPIFYGSNSKKTAAFEVLQDYGPGYYQITIGCWECQSELRLVNFVDGTDPDFKDISFVHSRPKEYLQSWDAIPRESATHLLDFFNSRFKMPKKPGFYNVTNVIAAFCFSLLDVDGIGYGAISSGFAGYNIALKNPSIIKCVTVEEWSITKFYNNQINGVCTKVGAIDDAGNITW